MNDIINHVEKVITDNDTRTYVFIIRTEGETDFWWWQVDFEDVADYIVKYPLYLLSGGITKDLAERFCNDLDNDTKGTCCSSYESIEDILKEFGIIK